MKRALRSVALGVAGLSATLLMSACANYPSADYARAACDDLSALMNLASPSHDDVVLQVRYAAARAQRAARTDGAFEDFYADLRELRDAVAAGGPLASEKEQRLDAVLGDLAVTCAELGAPVESRGGLEADVSWRSLNGS